MIEKKMAKAVLDMEEELWRVFGFRILDIDSKVWNDLHWLAIQALHDMTDEEVQNVRESGKVQRDVASSGE